MKTNNYNTSTEEQSIEITCFRDTMDSRGTFDDLFTACQHSGYYDRAIYEYHGGEKCNVCDPDDLYNWEEVTRKGARAYCMEHYQDPKECITDMFYHGTWEDLARHILNEEGWNEIAREGIPEHPGMHPAYRMTYVTGHSQGDYAYILTPNTIEPWKGERECYERYLYDAPVYLHIEIDEMEIHLYEIYDDEYEWEPEKIIQYLKKQDGISRYAIDYIEEHLPEWPEYI